MSDKDLFLYAIEISKSATMYVIAENRRVAEEIAEEDSHEAFLDVNVTVEYANEVDCLERVPSRYHKERCYGKDMTVKQFFTQEEGEPVITQAELEAAGQMRLP